MHWFPQDFTITCKILSIVVKTYHKNKAKLKKAYSNKIALENSLVNIFYFYGAFCKERMFLGAIFAIWHSPVINCDSLTSTGKS